MNTVEVTPPRSVRRRNLFHPQTPSRRVQSQTPETPAGKQATFTPRSSAVSVQSSPDRYSSPPHSPRWILDTPPKVTGSLISSPSRFLDDNMPSRMSRFDLFLNSLSLKQMPKSEVKQASKEHVVTSEEACDNVKCDEPEDKESNCICPCENVIVMPLQELQKPFKPKELRKNLISENKENLLSPKKCDKIDVFIPPSSFYKSANVEMKVTAVRKNESFSANNKFMFFGGVKRNRSSSVESTRTSSERSTKSRTSKVRLSKRMRLGEINIGVRHGIRTHKPKKKPPTVRPFRKLPKIMPSDRIKSLFNSPLVKGTQDPLNRASTSTSHKTQVTPKKFPSPKKIPTPPPDPTKKFFKTNRTLHISKAATVTMENNMKVEVRSGKFRLPKKELQKHSSFRGSSAQKKLYLAFEPIDTDDTPRDMLQDNVSETVNAILSNLESEAPKEVTLASDCDAQIITTAPKEVTLASECHAQIITTGTNSLNITDCRLTETEAPVTVANFYNANNELEIIYSTSGKQQLCDSAKSNAGSNGSNIVPLAKVCDSEIFHKNNIVKTSTNNIPIRSQVAGVETDAKADNTNIPSTANINSEIKLYPVFQQTHAQKCNSTTPVLKNDCGTRKRKWQMIGDDQYQIDAGQKKFGATQCKECGIVYQLGDWEDEMTHQNYHNNVSALKFCGWKDERIICVYGTERVIVVYPDDSKLWLKKVKAVMDVANRETGYVDVSYTHKYLENSKVYMYVNQKSVMGILVAEPKKEAYKMLSMEGVDCCSAETYPVWCGISHIWTAPNYRRLKVATRLVDCMRVSFMFDHFLEKDEFAFSVPTIFGKSFAEKYTGTPNFLVYS